MPIGKLDYIGIGYPFGFYVKGLPVVLPEKYAEGKEVLHQSYT